MKTKTLLIAAAALAAGVISSEAQVYSQNVVGYVNQQIPANSYQIVGAQLLGGSDANQTNGDINVTLINGLISSPNDPGDPAQVSAGSVTNSQLFVWNGSGYAVYYFFNQADATIFEGFASPTGWYTVAGIPAAVNLNTSHASFLRNVSLSSSMTLTTTGNVRQGTNVTTIANGYNLISLQVPISTNPVVPLYGLPSNLTSGDPSVYDPVNDVPNQTHNDAYYAWTGAGYAVFYYFTAADATSWEGAASPAGFYDVAGPAMPSSFYPKVNQGFFLYHTGGTINWTNSFTVQ